MVGTIWPTKDGHNVPLGVGSRRHTHLVHHGCKYKRMLPWAFA
jgi:hypothetical protein